MALCSFCKHELERATGKMYVRRDGSALYFCSTKCQRNMVNLGRSPRNVQWLTKNQPGVAKVAAAAKKAVAPAVKTDHKGGKK
jgi:large subunit ribosomal protein L24e